MSDDLLVRIDANTTGYEAACARAERATHSFEYELRRLQAVQKQQEAAALAATRAQEAQAAAMVKLGRGMMVAGAAIGVGLGLAAKAAIDWESAWTGVAKTVDGSPEQLAALEKELRGLTEILPVSHEEIAGVAEAAGQLGVKAADIAEFTKTMVMLGETTNLTSEDAATGLAKFANILGTAPDQIDNVGASLVALGNNGASTEADILALSLRLASAGNQAGMSEGDVLGMANALSSLGVEAESGGTAVSQTFQMMSKAVAGGGDALAGFAKVAGVSADVFSQKYGDDAAGALGLFVDGLAQVKAEGGNVYQTLNDLGITGARQIDVLTRLAGSGEQLADSVKLGNDAFAENNALQAEAEKRFATTEAKIQLAKNAFVEMGIDMGTTLLPALEKVLDLLTTGAQLFSDLPGPVKEFGAVLATAAAALLLFNGAVLVLGPKLTALKAQMIGTALAGNQMSKGMMAARGGALAIGAGLAVLSSHVDDSDAAMKGLLSTSSMAAIGFSVGGPWGAAVGGGVGLLSAFADANSAAQAEVDALTGSLDQNTGSITEQSRVLLGQQLIADGLVDNISQFGLTSGEVVDAMLDIGGAAERVRSTLAPYSDAVAGVTTASGDLSAEQRNARVAALELLEAIGGGNSDIEAAKSDYAFLADATARTGAASADAAPKVMQLGGAIEDSGQKAAQNATEYRKNADALRDDASAARQALDAHNALADALLGAIDGQIAFRNSVREAMKGAKDFTGSIFAQTAAADEQKGRLSGVAAQWNSLTPKVQNASGAYKDARSAFLDVADSMNVTKGRAQELADKWLDMPTDVNTEVKADTSDAEAGIDRTQGKADHLDNTTAEPSVTADTGAAENSLFNLQEQIDNLRDGYVTVTTRYVKSGVQDVPAAGGGYITGPGTGTSDSIPAWLSNGEYVIKASSAKQIGLENLHRMNALGYKDGGPVGEARAAAASEAEQALKDLLKAIRQFKVKPGETASETRSAMDALLDALKSVVGKDSPLVEHLSRMGDKLVEVAKLQDKATEQFDKASDKLKDLQQQAAQFAQSVADAFTHDAFGGSMADSLLQLKADANDAREAERDLAKAKAKGLDGKLLRELAASGNTVLIDELSHASRSEIADYERLLKRRSQATGELGRTVADDLYGKQIAHQTRVVNHLDNTLQRLNKRLAEMGDKVRDGAHDGTRAGNADRDHRVATRRRAGR